MTDEKLEQLRYPVGRFSDPDQITQELRFEWIYEIESFPGKLKSLVLGLSDEQLELTYRPDGWTIAQVVHHCADSHMNSIIRFKLALTEENPTIRPYYEERWAELVDGKETNLEDSINLVSSVHSKWVKVLKSMNNEDWKRTFIHPENNETIPLDLNLAIYAWHCRHHLGHVKLALGIK